MARSTSRTAGDTPRSGTPPAAGLLLVVGLLAGCGLMALIAQLGGQAEPAAPTTDATLTKSVERVADRVDRLLEQQADIARRMTGLELAMHASPAAREVMPITSAGVPVELSEIKESMAQFASALEAGDNIAQGPIVNQVIEAMRVIEETQDAEREAERAERRLERLDEQLADLAELLGMDVNQQASMRDLLTDAAKQREAMDEITSRNERRDARDALRADVQGKVSGFLSPAQLQLLEDNGGLDLGGRGGPPGGFGGGGGGGGRGGRGGR